MRKYKVCSSDMLIREANMIGVSKMADNISDKLNARGHLVYTAFAQLEDKQAIIIQKDAIIKHHSSHKMADQILRMLDNSYSYLTKKQQLARRQTIRKLLGA